MIEERTDDIFNPRNVDLGGALQRIGRWGFLIQAVIGALLFTALWFFLYARLGRRIASGEAWTRRGLLRRVWVGVAASATGLVFSAVVMTFEVGHMLFRFLEAPQGGVPVVQVGDQASWISALDMLGLLALNLTIVAEVIVLVMGLLLLQRVAQAGKGSA